MKSFLGALRDMRDSQLEFTLLRSHLVPIFFFHTLQVHPLAYPSCSCGFNHAMQDAVQAILGGPMSNW